MMQTSMYQMDFIICFRYKGGQSRCEAYFHILMFGQKNFAPAFRLSTKILTFPKKFICPIIHIIGQYKCNYINKINCFLKM
jgi:hypothetical protein